MYLLHFCLGSPVTDWKIKFFSDILLQNILVDNEIIDFNSIEEFYLKVSNLFEVNFSFLVEIY